MNLVQAWFLWMKAAFAWSARSSEHGRLEAIRQRSIRIFNTTNVSMSSAPWWYRPEVEKLSCVSNRMSMLLLANRSSLLLSLCFLGLMVRSSWCGITIRFIVVRRFKRFLANIQESMPLTFQVTPPNSIQSSLYGHKSASIWQAACRPHWLNFAPTYRLDCIAHGSLNHAFGHASMPLTCQVSRGRNR